MQFYISYHTFDFSPKIWNVIVHFNKTFVKIKFFFVSKMPLNLLTWLFAKYPVYVTVLCQLTLCQVYIDNNVLLYNTPNNL